MIYIYIYNVCREREREREYIDIGPEPSNGAALGGQATETARILVGMINISREIG